MATRILPGNLGADQTRADFFFKPNIQLLGQALATKQKDYDTKLVDFKKLKAKVSEVPSLEGYDRKRHTEKQLGYQKSIDNIMNLYNGDLTKSTAQAEELFGVVGKDFGIHGEMTAIKNRHTGYMTNYKDVTTRRKDGDITKAQEYQLKRKLAQTRDVGIGTDHTQYNPWGDVNLTDAVNRPEFLEKFVANAKESSNATWGQGSSRTSPTGVLEWRKDKDTWISEKELLEQASSALRNELKKTGELEAEWTYDQEVRGGAKPSKEYYDQFVGNAQEKLDGFKGSINELNTLHGSALQTAINKLYQERTGRPIIKVDGIAGPQTERAKRALMSALENDVKQSQNAYNKLASADPIKVATTKMFDTFIADIIRKEAEPYAGKIAHMDHDEDLKVMKNPVWAHSKEIELAKIKHSFAIAISDHEFKRDKEYEVMERFDTGVTVESPYGKTLTEFGDKKNQLLQQKGGVETSFFAQIAASEKNPDGTPKYANKIDRDNAMYSARDASKITNDDIAQAQKFENRGGKIIMTNKDGDEVVLSENSDLSVSALHEIQRNAQGAKNLMDIHNQAYNEAGDAVKANPTYQWTVEELNGLENAVEWQNEFVSTSKQAYELNKKYNPNMTYEDFKTSIIDNGINGSSFTKGTYSTLLSELRAKEAAGDKNAGDLLDLIEPMSIGTNWKPGKLHAQQEQLNSVAATKSKYDKAMNHYLGTMTATPLSGKSSNRIYSNDGKYWLAEGREKGVNEFFQNQQNTNTLPMYLPGENGTLTAQTMPQYLQQLSAATGKQYTYELGSALGKENKNAFSLPFTVYELDDKGRKTDKIAKQGTTRVGFEDVNFGFLKHWREDPRHQTSMQLQNLAESGLKVGKYTQHNPVTRQSYNYTINRAEDAYNPDPYHYIDNSTVTFDNYQSPIIHPGGFIEMEEVIIGGRRQLQPKLQSYSGTMPYAEAEELIRKDKHLSNISKELYEKGIPNDYVALTFPSRDSKGNIQRDAKGRIVPVKRHVSVHMKVAELIDIGEDVAPERIVKAAKTLKLTDSQIGDILNIRETRRQYKTKINPHPDELIGTNPYKITTSTYKFR